MKKFFNYRHIYLLGILLYITSCQKPEDLKNEITPTVQNRAEYDKNLVDESISGLYDVRQGILHFKNLESFQKTWDAIQSATIEERSLFWEKDNFQSYAKQYSEVVQKLSAATNKSDYDSIYAENQDIVKTGENGRLKPQAGDFFINHFINRQGLVYIGKMLYSFGENQQKIAFDGSLTTIKGNQNSKQLMLLNNTVSSVNNAKLASCTYFNTSVTQNGDRKATASTQTNTVVLAAGFNHLGQPLHTIRWTIRVLGYPEKKNVWGNWVNYSTANTLKASFYLYVKFINPPYSPYPFEGHKYVNCNYSNTWSDITYDDYLEFTNVLNPETIVSQQYSYVEAGGVGWNTYSTGGVSEFTYGCP